ncbi:hypothetical protein SB757_33315, partial [Pseudomonas sp. SIMBA_065]
TFRTSIKCEQGRYKQAESQGRRSCRNQLAQTIFKQFDAIIDVHQKISEYQLAFNSYLNESENKILTSLQDSRYPDEDGKIK